MLRQEVIQRSFETGLITWRDLYERIWLVELVYRDKKRRTSLETQRKLSKIRKEDFFGISKLSDIGRFLENVFGKFWKCVLGSMQWRVGMLNPWMQCSVWLPSIAMIETNHFQKCTISQFM